MKTHSKHLIDKAELRRLLLHRLQFDTSILLRQISPDSEWSDCNKNELIGWIVCCLLKLLESVRINSEKTWVFSCIWSFKIFNAETTKVRRQWSVTSQQENYLNSLCCSRIWVNQGDDWIKERHHLHVMRGIDYPILLVLIDSLTILVPLYNLYFLWETTFKCKTLESLSWTNNRNFMCIFLNNTSVWN